MFDDDAPPTKRLKLIAPKTPRSNGKFAPKKDNRRKFVPRKILSATPRLSPNPQQDFRKRKIATRRPAGSSIYNLNQHVFMEVFDFLSLEDLCNLTDTSARMRQLAEEAFIWRARHGLTFYRNGAIDIGLLERVFAKFGHLFSSITISTGR